MNANAKVIPHLRGTLVAVHLVAITAGSLPVLVDERILTPETWKDPVALQEFGRWSNGLAQIGIERSVDEVGAMLWDVASSVLRFQRTVQAPFQGYYQEAGTRQRWRMFPASVEETLRFRIDVERNGGWETIYRMGDPERPWGREHFDRDRVRAALNLYAWGLYPESYEQLVDWIAARAPGEGKVRIGFEALPAIAPGEAGRHREASDWPEQRLVRERERR